jgi:hypothetical protein
MRSRSLPLSKDEAHSKADEHIGKSVAAARLEDRELDLEVVREYS